jgi:thioredoxin-dependent peroxiredoxin
MLQTGDRIPDFDLATDLGTRVSPRTLAGKRTVLFFYPKDDTPACTQEACAFRDALPGFRRARVDVYGISADDEKKHGRFAGKYGLDFPLIADPERRAIDGFGVWIEKQLYGRKYMGIARTTFVIDADGRIEQVWDKVKPAVHAEEVLAYLRGEAAVPPKPAAKPAAKKPTVALAPAKKAAAKKKPVAKKAATKKSAPRR